MNRIITSLLCVWAFSSNAQDNGKLIITPEMKAHYNLPTDSH